VQQPRSDAIARLSSRCAVLPPTNQFQDEWYFRNFRKIVKGKKLVLLHHDDWNSFPRPPCSG
jgi:hypothetical protein